MSERAATTGLSLKQARLGLIGLALLALLALAPGSWGTAHGQTAPFPFFEQGFTQTFGSGLGLQPTGLQVEINGRICVVISLPAGSSVYLNPLTNQVLLPAGTVVECSPQTVLGAPTVGTLVGSVRPVPGVTLTIGGQMGILVSAPANFGIVNFSTGQVSLPAGTVVRINGQDQAVAPGTIAVLGQGARTAAPPVAIPAAQPVPGMGAAAPAVVAPLVTPVLLPRTGVVEQLPLGPLAAGLGTLALAGGLALRRRGRRAE
jgi:hypothetical protein